MLYIAYFIVVSSQNIKKKFLCLRRLHITENLPKVAHIQNSAQAT